MGTFQKQQKNKDMEWDVELSQKPGAQRIQDRSLGFILYAVEF